MHFTSCCGMHIKISLMNHSIVEREFFRHYSKLSQFLLVLVLFKITTYWISLAWIVWMEINTYEDFPSDTNFGHFSMQRLWLIKLIYFTKKYNENKKLLESMAIDDLFSHSNLPGVMYFFVVCHQHFQSMAIGDWWHVFPFHYTRVNVLFCCVSPTLPKTLYRPTEVVILPTF